MKVSKEIKIIEKKEILHFFYIKIFDYEAHFSS